MPDAATRLTHTARDQARLALDAALRAKGLTPLAQQELMAYEPRRISHGWRASVTFPDGERRMDVLLPPGFPRKAAKIAMVDRPPFLSWPHVEKDGVLCLLSSASEVSSYNPIEVTQQLLGDAAGLVEELAAGARDADFTDEFLSYWSWDASVDAPAVRSLLLPRGPSRPVRLWRGKRFYLLGESDKALETWLHNLGGTTSTKHTFEPAVLIWREGEFKPSDYPRSASGLLAIADTTARPLLQDLARSAPASMICAIGVSTRNGPAFGAVRLRPAPDTTKRRGRDAIAAGFRPGHVPEAIASMRYLGRASFERACVERVDASWIHGRDQDARQAKLFSRTVTVLGCGSIGSSVADTLAQAGVGRIRLVDRDLIEPPNAGRHRLGVDAVGRYKSAELSRQLSARFPHAQFDHAPVYWEDLPDDFGLFEKSSLVISAIGSGSAEGALNEAQIAAGRATPVLYGWTEPHACAGHSVLIGASGGCLQCGLDVLGGASLRVTNWPVAGGLKQEPACGGVFQPYGAVQLGYISSMIAEHAIDALCGDASAGEHRIWTTSGKRLQDVGGEWSSIWLGVRGDAAGAAGAAGLHERSWSEDPACPECGAGPPRC